LIDRITTSVSTGRLRSDLLETISSFKSMSLTSAVLSSTGRLRSDLLETASIYLPRLSGWLSTGRLRSDLLETSEDGSFVIGTICRLPVAFDRTYWKHKIFDSIDELRICVYRSPSIGLIGNSSGTLKSPRPPRTITSTGRLRSDLLETLGDFQ
jgi:hypothetical protein